MRKVTKDVDAGLLIMSTHMWFQLKKEFLGRDMCNQGVVHF